MCLTGSRTSTPTKRVSSNWPSSSMTYPAELCCGCVDTSWRGWGWRGSIFRRSYWTFFSSGSRRNWRTLTTSSLSVSLHDYNRRRGLRYPYLVRLRCGGLEKKKYICFQ